MADGKKSFILYCDQIHAFETLQDDEAGRLIKHIFRYTNDQYPEVPDRITEISFAPIKQQLKRDLKDWEVIKQDKSNSGKLGNLKRWNKDLYEKVVNRELDILEAELIAKGRKATKLSQSDKTIANVAVNVNDNVNVNVKRESTAPANGLEKSNLFNKPIIPTKQQVWEAIQKAGGTKEMAKSFYEKHEGTGWFINSSPVVNYTALASKFVSTWRSIDEKDEKKNLPEKTAPTLKRLE